ncbi:MAG: hypothetical protein ACOYT4_02680 [Nanoarchaeota archaeon]
MSEKSTVFDQTIKHKGYFNFSDLYNFCFGFLKDSNYNVAEKEYAEKDTPIGKEIKISWEAGKKISDYFKNVIEVKWQILGLNEAEIERDGRKEKTNKGEIKISFTATIVSDYEDRWQSTPTYKFMRSIYDKYIIRTTKEQYEDKLAEKTDSFVQQVKAFLELQGRK